MTKNTESHSQLPNIEQLLCGGRHQAGTERGQSGVEIGQHGQVRTLSRKIVALAVCTDARLDLWKLDMAVRVTCMGNNVIILKGKFQDKLKLLQKFWFPMIIQDIITKSWDSFPFQIFEALVHFLWLEDFLYYKLKFDDP